MDKRLETIKKKCRELDNMMLEYSNYGAMDTEPRAVRAEIFGKLMDTGEPTDATAISWDLFKSMPRVRQIEKRLGRKANTIQSKIMNLPFKLHKEARDILVQEFDIPTND